MKKILLVCIFVRMLISAVIADEVGSNSRGRFSLSWGVEFDSQPEVFCRTSVIGISFVLFNNNRVDIRNQLEFCNGVMIMEDLDVKYYK